MPRRGKNWEENKRPKRKEHQEVVVTKCGQCSSQKGTEWGGGFLLSSKHAPKQPAA